MSKELATIATDQVPDYLREYDGGTGLEHLDKSDFKTPRILLLQGLSPQLIDFAGQAKANNYWHNIAQENLGQEFTCVILNITKRVIVWRPRWEGGGVLAYSSDARKWDTGGNTTFRVRPDSKSKDTVEWSTKADVKSSRLCEFGTYNPADDNSPPAASRVYEYTIYIPERAALGPAVFGMSKTALAPAVQLQTSLLAKRKPIQSMYWRVGVDMQERNGNKWSIPSFTGAGFVENAKQFEVYTELRNSILSLEIDIQDDEAEPPAPDVGRMAKELNI